MEPIAPRDEVLRVGRDPGTYGTLAAIGAGGAVAPLCFSDWPIPTCARPPGYAPRAAGARAPGLATA